MNHDAPPLEILLAIIGFIGGFFGPLLLAAPHVSPFEYAFLALPAFLLGTGLAAVGLVIGNKYDHIWRGEERL